MDKKINFPYPNGIMTWKPEAFTINGDDRSLLWLENRGLYVYLRRYKLLIYYYGRRKDWGVNGGEIARPNYLF